MLLRLFLMFNAPGGTPTIARLYNVPPPLWNSRPPILALSRGPGRRAFGYPSFRRRISLTIFGLALPLVARITSPTKKPISLVLPPLKAATSSG